MKEMERVKQISDVVFIINLPDGITPGRMEAAEYFANAISELRGFLVKNEPVRNHILSVATFDIEKGNYRGVQTWIVIVTSIRI